MGKLEQLRDQRWNVVEWERVPRSSALLIALLAHLVALPLLLPRHTQTSEGVHLRPEEYKAATMISGGTHLRYDAKAPPVEGAPVRSHRSGRAARALLAKSAAPATPPPGGPPSQGASSLALGEQARRATTALTQSFRFFHEYGFFPSHEYKLAIRTAGELPHIAPEEVPPRFEQMVTVQVTIDVDGHVAEARVTSGMVPTAVEDKLLAAIRDFRYNPAKRDGFPIPSLVDIVVHVPS